MMKTKLTILLPLLLLAFMVPAVTKAFEVETGEAVYISQDQTIDGNLYAVGNSVVVDGDVNGDVICAGQTISINGDVKGDVICVGQMLNITGKVGGSVRSVGNSLTISSKIERNLMAFGANIVLGSDSSVGWDALVGGATISVNGSVKGNLHGGGSTINIGGNVGKDVDLDLDCNSKSCLTIGSGAIVKGDVLYRSRSEINILDGGVIKGEVVKKQMKIVPNKGTIFSSVIWIWLIGILMSALSAFLIGLILILFCKNNLEDANKVMRKKPWVMIGWGAIAVLLTPIVAIIASITIIGLPLAAILILSWIVLLLIAKVFTAVFVGKIIMDKVFNMSDRKKYFLFWSLVTGIIVSYIIFSIPFIGGICAFVAVLFGVGGIIEIKKKCCK